MKDKIFISACFLGEKVRYDGQHKALHHRIIKQWKSEGRLVGGCPECLGGLSIPRDPAEIRLKSNVVVTDVGIDVTSQFIRGAEKALAICHKENIQYALLKESSPSCGSHYIYDGTFTHTKVQGKGITAALFHLHNIKVFSEDNIDDLYKLIN